jgi:hypothetical protein
VPTSSRLVASPNWSIVTVKPLSMVAGVISLGSPALHVAGVDQLPLATALVCPPARSATLVVAASARIKLQVSRK